MNVKKALFVIFLLLTLFGYSSSAFSSERFPLDINSLDQLSFTCSTTTFWKYHEGDNALWKNISFNDTNWEISKTLISEEEIMSKKTGWFRLNLDVDSSLWNKSINLNYGIIGAVELYFNEKLIFEKGVIGNSSETEEAHYLPNYNRPIVITIPPIKDQLIAVRFSAFNEKLRIIPDISGGVLLFADTDSLAVEKHIELKQHVFKHQMFSTGLCFAFFLIHIFVFLFNRTNKENLYFALFTISCALLSYAPIEFNNVSHIDLASRMLFLFKLSLIGCSIFSIRLLYAIYYEKIPVSFRILAGIGVVILIFHSHISFIMFYVITLLYFIEVLRVVIQILREKREYSWIIGVGFMSFLLLSAYQMLIELLNLPLWENPLQPYMVGLLILMVSLSAFIAYSITSTSKKLAQKLTEVQTLSDQAIEQERRVKDQQMKQKLLEADINHQREQLEKAKELEKAYNELEAATKKIKETQTQLIQSEKMASLGQLVAGVAHEVNNPVGAIKSIHETQIKAYSKLKEQIDRILELSDTESADITKYLRIIENANKVISNGSDRVSEIVRRLKSFARLDEAELQRVDVNECIEDTLSLIHHEIKHDVIVNKSCGEVPPIACYPGQLNQVLLNILINAKHAIEDVDRKGEIHITTFFRENRVLLIIEDNGKGIPEENLSRIFDPGYTTKGVGVGTGLGLSICYQIIKDHHGDIKVESKVGAGTMFVIDLPSNLEEILGKDTSNS